MLLDITLGPPAVWRIHVTDRRYAPANRVQRGPPRAGDR
jgi:hypothetical protein